MPEHSSFENRHYPSLDGLRGLAVLMVVIHHFFTDNPIRGPIGSFAYNATVPLWTGVDLFFVLSGFLITGLLLDSVKGPHYFKAFYARRILRIFPLYYAILVGVFFVLPSFGLIIGSLKDSLPLFTFTSNIHIGRLGYWIWGPLDVYWSLGLEEQFYILWPLLIYSVRSTRLKWIIGVGLIGTIVMRLYLARAGVGELYLYTMLPTHGDGLLVGALIAVLIREHKRFWHPSPRSSITLAAMILGVLALGSFHIAGVVISASAWNLKQAVFYYSIIAAAFGSILYLCIASENPIAHFFRSRTLRWFGKYSYALYLFHPLTSFLVIKLFHRTGIDGGVSELPEALGVLIYITSFCITSLAAAWLSWRVLERPMLRLKRYFPYDRTSVTPASTVV